MMVIKDKILKCEGGESTVKLRNVRLKKIMHI